MCAGDRGRADRIVGHSIRDGGGRSGHRDGYQRQAIGILPREHGGAEHDRRGEPDPITGLKKLTNDDLPTCVIDATGNAQSMARCFELAASGGRIIFVGLFQGDLTFNDPNFHRRELTLLASRNSRPEDFDRIIGMVERGEIDTNPWITHRARFDQAVEEFPKWLEPDSGVLKAMIEL